MISTFEEANALIDGAGVLSIMSIEERRYVWDCAKDAADRNLLAVEVGSAYGGTTAIMGLAGAHTVSVENWECGQEAAFDANMARLGLTDAVRKVTGDSVQSASMFPVRNVGCVLIDGSHLGDYPWLDLQVYAPLVSPQGFLLVDDIHNGHPDVTIGLLRWLAAESDFVFDRGFNFVESCSSRHHLIKLCGFRRKG